MARQREFEGRNVAEAVDKACQSLEVDAKKIKYDVISYGSTGIFGLVGARKAKITVKVPNTHQKAPAAPVPAPEPAPVPAVEARRADDDAEASATAPVDSDAPQQGSGSRDLNMEKARAEAYLGPIAEAISDNPTIDSRLNGDGIEIDLNSDNPAVLIGKRGQTLMAMQYLLERALNHHCTTPDGRIHVHLDVAGYQAARRENLVKLSHRLAEKAQRNGKPVTIGQLNPAERRIVHVALKGNHAVRTQSIGGGYVRKLTIFPSRNRSNHTNAGQQPQSS